MKWAAPLTPNIKAASQVNKWIYKTETNSDSKQEIKTSAGVSILYICI